MHVQKIIEYPEQGIAILYDEHGRFVANRDNLDLLDIGQDEKTPQTGSLCLDSEKPLCRVLLA